jgi:hypothetical protein
MTLGMFEDTTDGICLPHPQLSLRSHLVVEAAICVAWKLVLTRVKSGFDLQSATEDAVTHELYERLYDEVFDKGLVDGFNREVFASVRREPKIRNFNGSNLDKMPDLLVEFVDRPAGVMNSQYGIFIECKPVDADHTVGVHYCDKGLVRFVRGDYAWAMQSAMMIGYARSGYTIHPKLSDALQARSQATATKEEAQPCRHSIADSTSESVHVSKHARMFKYAETGNAAPAILIRHLWLKRD